MLITNGRQLIVNNCVRGLQVWEIPGELLIELEKIDRISSSRPKSHSRRNLYKHTCTLSLIRPYTENFPLFFSGARRSTMCRQLAAEELAKLMEAFLGSYFHLSHNRYWIIPIIDYTRHYSVILPISRITLWIGIFGVHDLYFLRLW